MKRGEFLGVAAGLAAAATIPAAGCARELPRYVPPAPPARPGERLLLVNATVIDVERGETLPGRTLLLRDGLIAEIGAGAAAASLAVERRLDLAGAYLLPGLINAHCHLTLPGAIGYELGFFLSYGNQLERNAEECVRHGVTTARDMQAMGGQLTHLRAEFGAGRLVGPRLVRCCGLETPGGYADQIIFRGDSRYLARVNDPAGAREAVRRAVEHGADFIKLFHQPREVVLPGGPLPLLDTATLAAAADEAARRGVYVALHHSTRAGLRAALEAGIDQLEHVAHDAPLTEEDLKRVQAARPVFTATISSPFALIYETRDDPQWGQGEIPRLVQWRKELFPALFEEFCEPEMARRSRETFAKYSDPAFFEGWRLLPAPDPRNATKEATIGFANLRALAGAGVTFGCGNDGGVPFVFPGAMWLEMALLEDLGFPPPAVLKMATVNNARLLRRETEIGTIEKGKRADLLVVRENPLLTARHLAHPLLVFQAGQLMHQAPASAPLP